MHFEAPSILEVGVDRGVMTFPILTHLSKFKDLFTYVGIDIMIQESVKLMTQMFGEPISKSTYFIEDSSLNALPSLVKSNMKFDLILLDGDHNYHTVAQELKYVNDLTHDKSIVIIDDYDGKWAERDLWYADRPGYETNTLATKPIDTKKHGVKPAVNEWLQSNSHWKVQKPIPGEPIMLLR